MLFVSLCCIVVVIFLFFLSFADEIKLLMEMYYVFAFDLFRRIFTIHLSCSVVVDITGVNTWTGARRRAPIML